MGKSSFIFQILFYSFFLCFFSQELRTQVKQYAIYGYGQVDFLASNKTGSISGFDQRRINIIGEFFPDEKMRILTDVEYEGGATINGQDSAHSGTIKISRGWLEYTFLPEVKLRAGKMLTPFGLYNLVHDASASYFPPEPPIMYSELTLNNKRKAQRLYSKYQIGIEVLGTINLDDAGSQLDYTFGIGNGRGSKGDGTDINNNRSLSSRVILRLASFPGFQLGSSFYFDRNYSGLGGIQNDLEYTTGIDLQYEDNSIQFQMEGMMSDYEVTDNKRQATGVGYVQLVYTMFDVLSPFINHSIVLYNLANWEKSFSRTNVGINWAVSPNLYLKSEVQFHEADESFNDEHFNVFIVSAAFTF